MRKFLVSLLLIMLLASAFIGLVGNLNSAKADDQQAASTLNSSGSETGPTVANVASSQSFVEQGFSTELTVSVENTGSSTYNFYVTFYGNGIPLAAQPITLNGYSSTVVSLMWNTTGFALGNYTLTACAWSDLGQTIAIYSNCTGNKILVTCPGDLTGHFEVNFDDFSTFITDFIAYYPTGVCNPAADFNHDGKLDYNDLSLFITAYIAYYASPTPFVTQGGLTLSMSLQQTSYGVGEPVNMTLSINNVSTKTITFGLSASTFNFIVYNSTGIVYQYTYGKVFPTWVVLYSLAAGISLPDNLQWNQTCNLISNPSAALTVSNPSGLCPVFRASPGTYCIVGEALGMKTAPQQITIT